MANAYYFFRDFEWCKVGDGGCPISRVQVEVTRKQVEEFGREFWVVLESRLDLL